MKSAWVVPYSILIGLLVGGILVLLNKPSGGEAIQLKPLPTAAPMVIHVSGEVLQPGVYWLPTNSRVTDAITAAGGLTDKADESGLNLAALLEDGQKIKVTAKPELLDERTDPGNGLAPQMVFPLDLNSASQLELESLPEIGPKSALAILTYREEHGPFRTVDELDDVPGIGPGTLQTIRDLVTVSP
jgi:competence protein ComEA